MDTIIFKINKLLEQKKITKTAFAKQVGIHLDTVYNLTDEGVKFSTLIKICEVLNVPISHFIENDTEKTEIVNKPIEIYNLTDYRKKYFETLEKLNKSNEKILKMIKKIDTKIDTKTAECGKKQGTN